MASTTTYIALLRGINVGAARKVLMADLRQLFTSLHCTNVQTYIQSGNVVFEADDDNLADWQTLLETEITQRFGFDIPVIVRTAAQWAQLIAECPFSGEQLARCHVTFLAAEPDVMAKMYCATKAMKVAADGDIFIHLGTDIYLCLAGKYGDTKLSNSFFETQLRVRTTTRNWQTVLTLATMLA